MITCSVVISLNIFDATHFLSGNWTLMGVSKSAFISVSNYASFMLDKSWL